VHAPCESLTVHLAYTRLWKSNTGLFFLDLDPPCLCSCFPLPPHPSSASSLFCLLPLPTPESHSCCHPPLLSAPLGFAPSYPLHLDRMTTGMLDLD